MSENQHARTLIDDIAEYTLKSGKEIGWFSDPLTTGPWALVSASAHLEKPPADSVLRPGVDEPMPRP